MIVDKSGSIFENRRKENDRRKVNIKVNVDRRKTGDRRDISSKKSK